MLGCVQIPGIYFQNIKQLHLILFSIMVTKTPLYSDFGFHFFVEIEITNNWVTVLQCDCMHNEIVQLSWPIGRYEGYASHLLLKQTHINLTAAF